MKSTVLPLVLLSVLIAASVPQHFYYYTQLPEVVATHFGADGKPNDWMNRLTATLVVGGIQILLPLFLLGITWLSTRLPDSMLNIPNREYWLRPDNRAATISHMYLMLAWIAAITTAFMGVMSHLVFVANRDSVALNMTAATISLVIYLALVLSIAFSSMWRFRLPRTEGLA
ncbi:MAG: DUF1648 domain-containing protein [Planctomycetaceae bacterium]